MSIHTSDLVPQSNRSGQCDLRFSKPAHSRPSTRIVKCFGYYASQILHCAKKVLDNLLFVYWVEAYSTLGDTSLQYIGLDGQDGFIDYDIRQDDLRRK
jgi:hypothetical protein